MKTLICFLFILLLISNLICVAGRIVKYNNEKQRYEVWDEETGALINIILGSNERSASCKKENINSFPYQQGWPVQIPSGIRSALPLTIGDLTGDKKSEVFAMTYWDLTYIYDYLGNVISQPNFGNQPAFEDIDFDGINEIIAAHYIVPPICPKMCGVAAGKWDGILLNGFPNPPDTAVMAPTIEDINRDGNYEIAFVPYGDESVNNYKLGMYVLGSWGGLMPGFPVVFPFDIYKPPSCPGISYASPSVGDFDDDGIMELAAYTGNARMYLITSDGSHYRNWPLVFYYGPDATSLPVLGDIDNDGKLELAITSTNNILKLYVINEDASFVPGFPALLGQNGPAYRNPSLADVDGDGKLELYVLELCDRLSAYRNDGTMLPGWPIYLRVNGVGVSFSHFPTIGDIDGDGEMEIIAAGGTCDWCPDGVLVAYNFDGTLVEGFPIIIPYYGFIAEGPTLADLDNDGDIEICTASRYCDKSEYPAYIYCWDLPYPYDESKIAWNNYARDNQHTARYVNPAIKPPVVKRVEPDRGSYKGGQIVKIIGKHFLDGAKVFFDGVPSPEVQVADSETIFAKVPPHKPCFMYINELSVSPYELSEKLVNQPVVNNSMFNVEDLRLNNYINNSSENKFNDSINQADGCVVNVVVVHPSPDQREGILRAGFTYTGYEAPKDDITLFVSKYNPMGTFENNGANWLWMSGKGLWNIIDDDFNCIPKPYPSGHKAMYYGDKSKCNYDTGERNKANLKMPYIKVEGADARIRFKYFRDVEYNPSRNADEFYVMVEYNMVGTLLWRIDSQQPSERAWVMSPELPLGNWIGKEVKIWFVFDTKDEIDNNHIGIAIDNVELIGAARWEPLAEPSGEVILNWTGGLPKYFVYRGTSPDFINNPPELRAYTPFSYKYENSLNNYESYYYKVR